MRLPGYYSSGQFAKMAQVSIRTIRFYDKQNILKPSYLSDSGARFYTDGDFARLQQILLLKYLGFSLDDIRGILVEDPDPHFLKNSLLLQKKLVQDKMEQMELVASAIDDTVQALEKEQEIDWSRMLDLIHLTGMEKSLKSQYQNASNISARIRLHKEFSTNPQGWFPWIYEVCTRVLSEVPDMSIPEVCGNSLPEVPGKSIPEVCGKLCPEVPGKKIPAPCKNVLELGCGNGALWTENMDKLPSSDIRITLSDISEGMIRDVRRTIGTQDARFDFATFDCHKIPFPDASFDLVLANHVLFYCEDIGTVCREVRRVLKPGGVFVCSTYGSSHMMEITRLVQEFDSRIVLSGEKLYERFGLENGADALSEAFPSVEVLRYEDEILLDQAEILIEYILSCHGNQNQYLLDRYRDFRSFVERKVKKGFHITKDAGVFVCRS